MSNDNQKFHEYDGIIEHDNPLPTWWLWSFLLAIIFSFLYFMHYEIAGGPTLQDELAAAMKEIDTMRSASSSGNLLENEDQLKAAFASEADLLNLGQEQYTARCAACHGNDLQGLIGPNLTDEFWVHGNGSRMDLVKLIRQGIPEKGMPPWESVLKKNEVYALSALILAKKGSNPAGAKPAQGEKSPQYMDANW